MSDINSSLVSSELTTIETFKDTTEKRGSKLTLNELNYISDKQLHAKGGSGEDSPVKLVDVTLHNISYFSEEVAWCGTTKEDGLPRIYIDSKPHPASFDDSKLLAPVTIGYVYSTSNGTLPSLFSVEGGADILDYPEREMFVIYITGDCTISYLGSGSWPMHD